MIDPKIVNAVQKGRNAFFIMERYGIPQATAFRLVKRIRSGQLDRKPGSGQPPKYLWNPEDVRHFLLSGSGTTVDSRLWTVQSIQDSIRTTLKLNVSLDTIRRRLNRAGLKPPVSKTCLARLNKHSKSFDRRSACFFIGQMEIDLHTLATNRRSDHPERLNIIYAVDRRRKFLFRCCCRKVTSADLIAVLQDLMTCHNNCFVICGTRLELSATVEKFLTKHGDEVKLVR